MQKRVYRQDGLSGVRVSPFEEITLPPPTNCDGHVPGVLGWRVEAEEDTCTHEPVSLIG